MGAVIDISSAGLQFRGAPVTLMSEGVEALFRRCGQSTETGIGLILRTAEDIEPCIVLSFAVGDVAVVYLGYDWTEPHRFEAARKHWAPWTVDCPLTRAPYLWKRQILDLFRERGIEPPRLYGYGFQHANCGGGCVRGGQAQWSLLLQVNRTRYLEWEAEEELSRAELGKDVSILRDRAGGTTTSLSLRSFRERIERQPSMFDAEDWGACGCFMDGTPPEGEAA